LLLLEPAVLLHEEARFTRTHWMAHHVAGGAVTAYVFQFAV
jgi:hypothetical protein